MTRNHFRSKVCSFLLLVSPMARTILFTLLAFHFLAPMVAAEGRVKDEPKKVASGPAPDQTAAPLTITLQDALDHARANSPQFQAAINEYQSAREDHVQARAGLLPTALYTNQYLYTQGNGTPTGRFIANNAVHEYVSQVDVHQAFGLSQFAEYRRSQAAEAVAQAKSEIAARGLTVTVVQNYYAVLVAQRRYATVQQAAEEARRFLKITQDLEKGGEVAHSDVIKAQLQFNDRQRDLSEARLSMEKSRLSLGILLFPDFNQNFMVVDDLEHSPALPSFTEVQQLAQQDNPDLRAALAALQVASQEMRVARAGYLPSLSLDYFYGIDATRFATKTEGVPNVGSSAIGTVNIPLWNWGATRSKVHQADLRRQQARVELTFAQRQLLSNLRSFFNEAAASHEQLETLRSSAELAADSLRLTTLRYQAGEASVLEVVDAQNTLTQNRNAYDDGEMRFRVALATLQTLTGSF
ncbi:MAG: TolC family protein [Acidobacteriia bacterium]|nr:TolC family protein [Terriglobia bacterium]